MAIAGLLLLAMPLAGLAATAPQDDPPTELWERFPIDPDQPDAAGPVELGEPPPLEESTPPPGSAAPADGESPAASDSGSDDLLLWGAGIAAVVALVLALVMWLRRPGRDHTPAAAPVSDTSGGIELPYPAASSPTPAGAPAAARPSFEVPIPPGTLPSAGDPFYDDPTCREFVAGLSTPVLRRAIVLFSALAERETVSAGTVAEELDVTPQELPGLLTTPLRRRANALGVPLPYVIARHSATGRRSWSDDGGIARRMEHAARAADAQRAAAASGPGDAPAPPSVRPPTRRA